MQISRQIILGTGIGINQQSKTDKKCTGEEIGAEKLSNYGESCLNRNKKTPVNTEVFKTSFVSVRQTCTRGGT